LRAGRLSAVLFCIYISPHSAICVLILLYMCPHTTGIQRLEQLVFRRVRRQRGDKKKKLFKQAHVLCSSALQFLYTGTSSTRARAHTHACTHAHTHTCTHPHIPNPYGHPHPHPHTPEAWPSMRSALLNIASPTEPMPSMRCSKGLLARSIAFCNTPATEV
jgi:hypothetical protein